MKECLACHEQMEDLYHACPSCGGESFMLAGSAADALSMLDVMQRQAEAAEHVNRSAEFAGQGRYAEAKRELNEAIRINPLNATAHGNMGGVCLKQGRPDEAVMWLEKALKLNPRLEGVPQALAQARAKVRRL